MKLLPAYTRAAGSIFRRDARIYFSSKLRIVSVIGSTLFALTVFWFVSRLFSAGRFRDPDEYFAFVVIGLVILAVLTSTLTTPPTALRQELVGGTFERLVLSAAGPVVAVLGMLLFPFVQAIATGLLTLILAMVFFGLPLESTAPLALPVAILGTLAFMPFGVLLTSVSVAFKQAPHAAGFVIAGLTLISGLYFPVDLLPDSIEWTSAVQPFTPSVDLLRHLLIGLPLRNPVWVDLLRLVGFAPILLPISIAVLALAIRQGQARGTILEY